MRFVLALYQNLLLINVTAMFYPTVIFLAAFSAMVSASHFRGGIFMVRPLPGGESTNDVSIVSVVLVVVVTVVVVKTLAENLFQKKVALALLTYMHALVLSTSV